MKQVPMEALAQHVAVLGKTGSGKTSTAKLAIEQVVAAGARVCVLDPIKSDWWGMTSSDDGKSAGLSFSILGGPHGHVPLHSSAGKAVADLVATGAMRLSIVDMADFEPGGLSRFFVDFAPQLLRKMRGVVYLVIEEAHLFAPKERSGIGAENLAIHWAKTLATAGRSKGIRLVLVTQRTQALHNALLGSCDTLIAHRLTAPADQEPVIKWLKANTTKAVLESVSASLSSLRTGQGWVCSGEAKLFECRQFERIWTYDNTATPTGDGQALDVTTAPVDTEKLRALIGEAVEQAKADDPKALRARIAELERQVKALPEPRIMKVPAVTEEDKAALVELARLMQVVYDVASRDLMLLTDALRQAGNVVTGLQSIAAASSRTVEPGRNYSESIPSPAAFGRQFEAAAFREPRASQSETAANPSRRTTSAAPAKSSPPAPSARPAVAGVSKMGQRILDALARSTSGELNREQLGVRCVARGDTGHFGNTISDLKTGGFIVTGDEGYRLTSAGQAAARPDGALDLVVEWGRKLSTLEAAIFGHIVRVYPRALSREQLGDLTGKRADSGHFGNSLSRLRTNKIVETVKGGYQASEELF